MMVTQNYSKFGAPLAEVTKRLEAIWKAITCIAEKLISSTREMYDEIVYMREVLRKCINEIRYPEILQINKLKIFTVDKTMSSSGAVAENNTTLSEHEREKPIQEVRNQRNNTLFRSYDEGELIIKNTAIRIRNCWMSKLNATRNLYREMANPEEKFQNKMKRINNKVKKLFETGAIKKFVGLQLKRLYNKSEKKPQIKRNVTLLDRLYNIRLFKMKISVKKTKKSLFKICSCISKLNLETAYQLVEMQKNLFQNYNPFKNTIKHFKVVEDDSGDHTPLHVGHKSQDPKKRPELRGTLRSRIDNYIKAAKGECEDSRLPAANRVQRVTIPEVFRHK